MIRRILGATGALAVVGVSALALSAPAGAATIETTGWLTGPPSGEGWEVFDEREVIDVEAIPGIDEVVRVESSGWVLTQPEGDDWELVGTRTVVTVEGVEEVSHTEYLYERPGAPVSIPVWGFELTESEWALTSPGEGWLETGESRDSTVVETPGRPAVEEEGYWFREVIDEGQPYIPPTEAVYGTEYKYSRHGGPGELWLPNNTYKYVLADGTGTDAKPSSGVYYERTSSTRSVLITPADPGQPAIPPTYGEPEWIVTQEAQEEIPPVYYPEFLFERTLSHEDTDESWADGQPGWELVGQVGQQEIPGEPEYLWGVEGALGPEWTKTGEERTIIDVEGVEEVSHEELEFSRTVVEVEGREPQEQVSHMEYRYARVLAAPVAPESTPPPVAPEAEVEAEAQVTAPVVGAEVTTPTAEVEAEVAAPATEVEEVASEQLAETGSPATTLMLVAAGLALAGVAALAARRVSAH